MTSTGPPTSSHTDRLTGDSLPLIDLRVLSHSELLSLSLSTARKRDNTSIPGICGDDDEHLLNPKIDRSVFNESAGSRRQTFSRLRLVPRQSAASAPTAPPPPPQQVTIEEEDPRVISLLRQLFRGEGWSHGDGLEEKIEDDVFGGELDGDPMYYVPSGIGTGSTSAVAVETVECKRKRGRPRKSTGNNISYDN